MRGGDETSLVTKYFGASPGPSRRPPQAQYRNAEHAAIAEQALRAGRDELPFELVAQPDAPPYACTCRIGAGPYRPDAAVDHAGRRALHL